MGIMHDSVAQWRLPTHTTHNMGNRGQHMGHLCHRTVEEVAMEEGIGHHKEAEAEGTRVEGDGNRDRTCRE